MTDDRKADLDKTLAEYLAQVAEDKRRGFTVAGLYMQMHEVLRGFKSLARRYDELSDRQDRSDEQSDELRGRIDEAHNRLDMHRSAIVILKRARQVPASEVEPGRGSRPEIEFSHVELDTGSFDIAAIQREVQEQKLKRLNSERVKADEHVWWKRTLIMWLGGSIGFVVVTAVTILITLALAKR